MGKRQAFLKEPVHYIGPALIRLCHVNRLRCQEGAVGFREENSMHSCGAGVRGKVAVSTVSSKCAEELALTIFFARAPRPLLAASVIKATK